MTWTLTRARYEEIWETLHRRLGFLQNDAAKLPPCSVREPTDVSGEWWRDFCRGARGDKRASVKWSTHPGTTSLYLRKTCHLTIILFSSFSASSSALLPKYYNY